MIFLIQNAFPTCNADCYDSKLQETRELGTGDFYGNRVQVTALVIVLWAEIMRPRGYVFVKPSIEPTAPLLFTNAVLSECRERILADEREQKLLGAPGTLSIERSEFGPQAHCKTTLDPITNLTDADRVIANRLSAIAAGMGVQS